MRLPALILSFLLVGCPANRLDAEPADAPNRPAPEFTVEPEIQGLQLVLSDAKSLDDRPDTVPLAHPTPLSADQTSQLLSRIPDLHEQDGDRTTFALRDGSLPPPRTGPTITTSFPPPPTALTPDPTEADPLTVVRFAPEGEVPMAPKLSVTFNHPMVAVTSHAEASKTHPVTIEPQPEGTWRWIGTKTLLFEPEVRFPMSTDYTVTVPKGTRSAIKGTLETESTWTFSTPTLSLEQYFPSSGPIALEPVIFVQFNQRIDEELWTHLSLRAGRESVQISPATPDQIAADPTVKQLVASATEGRWLAFVPVKPLNKATTYTIVVQAGAHSAEGPKPTASDLSWSFATYSPLKLEEYRCSWGDQACPPYAQWWVRFNNPLQTKGFDPKTVTVTPAIPEGISIRPSGNTLSFDGYKPGSRRYDVTIPAGLTDVFGQTLGKDQPVHFAVGKDDPRLTGAPSPMVVLDPQAPPGLSVYSTNHEKLRLRVYRVEPADWARMNQWWIDHNNDWRHAKDLPGTRLVDTTIKVGGDLDAMVETVIDLKPYVHGEHDQLMVWVTSTRAPREPWDRQEVLHWVQITDIGLTLAVDQDEMYAWASNLEDGAPLEGVEISIHPDVPTTHRTGADGHTTLPLPGSATQSALVVARKGDDVAVLPNSNNWYYSTGWSKSDTTDQMRWFVFDDRGMYKPGETVTVKGWMRRFEPRPTGDIGGVGAVERVDWQLMGPRGNELLEGSTDASALGGFDLSFELPGNVNLGQATLYLSAVGASGLVGTSTSHPVQIQEFRRPEFEVSVSVQPGPHILGDHVQASVSANYYAGGSLPNADTNWNATAIPASYSPPNRSDYTFGRWTPWWGGGWWWEPPQPYSPGAYHASKTDARGTHDLDMHLKSLNPPRPMTVNLQATVMDVNRQAWAASSTVLVHPAALYVGLKSKTAFVDKGDPIEVDTIVSDIGGELISDRKIQLEMVRLEWGPDESGRWKQLEKEPQPCGITSAQEPTACSFETLRGGEYQVTARIADDAGRPNESTLRIWVSGQESPPQRGVGMDQITLVPNSDSYAAGDVARVYVQAPFAPAHGVLSYRRSGMLHEESFAMETASKVLEIPIEEAHTPNLTVQIDLVGSQPRTDDKGKPRADGVTRPAYASGSLNLPVPPVQRTLSLEVVPRQDAIAPGGETTIDIQITDADGKPVQGGEVVVAVVDEAVLALTGYTLGNPMDLFYAQRPAGVADYHLRSQIILAQAALVTETTVDTPQLEALGYITDEENARAPGGGAPPPPPSVAAEPMEKSARRESKKDATGMAGLFAAATGEAQQQQAIALRTDFSALALFEPSLSSDANGKIAVPIKVPDSLTRYRILVIAADGGTRFGKGESGLTARNPVMVRPSAPRFLNFGDRAELPVVVQNQTGKAMTVDVAVRATNALLIGSLPADPLTVSVPGLSQAGQRIEVAANDRAEVRFPIAADMAGTARLQIAVSTANYADATQLSIPVWTPATTEAFATYGEIDDGAIAQPVTAPPDVWTQFGGLEITTSSTALQALTDAVIYLSEYPFSCNEQLSSRVLAFAGLRDVLDAFDAEGLPPSKELVAQVERDLKQLEGRQDYSGGFGFWKRGDPAWPYLSIHVAHAVARAEAKGFEVPPNLRIRSLSYLQNVEGHIPGWYDIRYRRMLIAYALYVRERMGDHDGKRARSLYAEAGLDGLSLEAQGWLLPVLHADGADKAVAEIRHHWGNKVSETAGAANFVTSYNDDAAYVILHSDRRVDAVLLEALITVDPKDTLIPKLVAGLLAHKTKGRWGNTQENAFVLLAMDAYFHEFESQTPDFVARAWLGKGFAGEHSFQGRTTERARIDIPMGYLTETKGPQDLTIQKDGTGRLYYRIGMRYAPKDLVLEPAEHGFSVDRVYESVDDPGDVVLKDGIWRIKAGSRVRVRVTMVAPSRRYHVALVDPLPAGLEAMNPALAVTGALPLEPAQNRGRYWWWSRTWYEHENLRDERVEAFTSLLWDGVHEYTYIARATTPGQFVVPPPRAEEMYSPETFGRGATARVVVY